MTSHVSTGITPTDKDPSSAIVVARCHEIHVTLGQKDVPEFESIPLLGMAVRLALHLQGLPIIDYSVLRMVAHHFLSIPPVVVERIVRILAEVNFVRIQSEGNTIKKVLPTVPYYGAIYEQLGEYAEDKQRLNEHEQLAIELLDRLAKSPEKLDTLRETIGADRKIFGRSVTIGTEGNYLIQRRARGRDILLNPTYFSENSRIFADAVAATGAQSVKRVLEAVRSYQGFPLELMAKAARLGATALSPDQVALLRRLAQDGIVRPPSITTTHSGTNHFIFTPTPAGAALSPTKREIYERAMAIVSAVRQGELLAKKYAIRSPGALLYRLKTDLRLARATTEATHQYRNLVHLRIARLIPSGGGFSELRIIDTPENREALSIAYSLVTMGEGEGLEIDEDARTAMQRDQEYVESLIASSKLREREKVSLDRETADQLELLLLGGRD
jgi:hypothetical protein